MQRGNRFPRGRLGASVPGARSAGLGRFFRNLGGLVAPLGSLQRLRS